MFQLDGKMAVVIGGAGGLGEFCAIAMAKQGAGVAIASRNLQKLNEVIKNHPDVATKLTAMRVDVTDEDSVGKLAEEAVVKFKKIDILVNAQGLVNKMPAHEINFETWDSMFATNVRGVMLSCMAFSKIMMAQKKGKIINFSSVRGVRATDGGNVTYGATKGAVDMITRMLAAEWAPYYINVNAIAPSVVLTETLKKSVAPERLQMLLSKTLFKRFCSPEDIAAACVYLASPESDYITGQILYVDGGLTAVG
jgi:NAD(P)-dependent dehydrogenase (short-subunit alcohol dehydrogenase family)